jgi:hypothetical protein
MPRLNAKMIAAGLVAVGLLLGAVALVSADEECSDFQHTERPAAHTTTQVTRIADNTASMDQSEIKLVGNATELSRTALRRVN